MIIGNPALDRRCQLLSTMILPCLDRVIYIICLSWEEAGIQAQAQWEKSWGEGGAGRQQMQDRARYCTCTCTYTGRVGRLGGLTETKLPSSGACTRVFFFKKKKGWPAAGLAREETKEKSMDWVWEIFPIMFALPPSPPPQFPLPIDPGGTELPIIHVGWNLPVIYYYYYYFRRDGTQGGSGGREGRGGGDFLTFLLQKWWNFPTLFLSSSLLCPGEERPAPPILQGHPILESPILSTMHCRNTQLILRKKNYSITSDHRNWMDDLS